MPRLEHRKVRVPVRRVREQRLEVVDGEQNRILRLRPQRPHQRGQHRRRHGLVVQADVGQVRELRPNGYGRPVLDFDHLFGSQGLQRREVDRLEALQRLVCEDRLKVGLCPQVIGVMCR